MLNISVEFKMCKFNGAIIHNFETMAATFASLGLFTCDYILSLSRDADVSKLVATKHKPTGNKYEYDDECNYLSIIILNKNKSRRYTLQYSYDKRGEIKMGDILDLITSEISVLLIPTSDSFIKFSCYV